tara:strand:+ start:3339 stop:3575 length:237 start_codon:yes stop_codon:yes gene_type:complete
MTVRLAAVAVSTATRPPIGGGCSPSPPFSATQSSAAAGGVENAVAEARRLVRRVPSILGVAVAIVPSLPLIPSARHPG